MEKIKRCVVIGALLCAAVSPTLANEQKVMEQQPLPPIDIDQYTARASADGEDVEHSVVVKNEMQETITAIQLVFVAHDAFSITGISRGDIAQPIRFHSQGTGHWTTPVHSGSDYVVFVDKVRFDNGDLWTADPEDVARNLREIDPDFDPRRLTGDIPPEHVVEIELKID